MTPKVLSLLLVMMLGVALGAQSPATSPTWLDKPVPNWNKPGMPVPTATPQKESLARLSKRCRNLPLLQTSAAEKALAAAGWLPFRLGDQPLVDRDVEVIGGLSAADGMCRPMDFNAFVFVGGQFAGTLSPQLMQSRADGSLGAVRLPAYDSIDGDFARYTEKDALCCPSSRVTARYRINRTTTPPVVVLAHVRAAME